LSIPITNAGLNGLGNYHVEKIEWDGDFIKSIFLTGPERIIYRFYPNEKIAFTAFQLGEVNRLEDLTHLENFKIWRKVKINKEADANRFAAIFFNFKGNFVGNEKSFRQALAYATNKSPFAEKKAYSSFSFESPYYTDAVKKYFYDEEAARNLLTKVLDKDKPDAKKINFTLYCAPEYETYAKDIVNNWNRVLGTAIKVRVSRGIPYTWQAYLVTSEIPTDPDQYSLWHSSKTFYFSNYLNLKVDKLLEDGRNIIETTKRKETYNELQKTLTEELPAIFLFYPWKYTISY
jgi:peptide/nickel transport system substrate-binding protein